MNHVVGVEELSHSSIDVVVSKFQWLLRLLGGVCEVIDRTLRFGTVVVEIGILALPILLSEDVVAIGGSRVVVKLFGGFDTIVQRVILKGQRVPSYRGSSTIKILLLQCTVTLRRVIDSPSVNVIRSRLSRRIWYRNWRVRSPVYDRDDPVG